MAELATIARPYAEALFKAAADAGTAGQLDAVAAVAAVDAATAEQALEYFGRRKERPQ